MCLATLLTNTLGNHYDKVLDRLHAGNNSRQGAALTGPSAALEVLIQLTTSGVITSGDANLDGRQNKPK